MLKRQDYQRVIPDLTIFLKDKILFIELKRRVKSLSKVSSHQEEWVAFLNTLPYAKAQVCYGAKEAIEFIEENL